MVGNVELGGRVSRTRKSSGNFTNEPADPTLGPVVTVRQKNFVLMTRLALCESSGYQPSGSPSMMLWARFTEQTTLKRIKACKAQEG